MAKNQSDILKTILTVAEEKPQKSIHMKRFGLDFVIQGLDTKTLSRLREQATFKTKSGEQIDNELFTALIIQKGCVVPDWSAKEFIDKYGDVQTTISSVLLSGEASRISGEILELSGFMESVDDLKN